MTAWLLYNIWECAWDTKRRMMLKFDDEGKFGLKGTNPRRKLALLKVADVVLRGTFGLFTKTMGLGGYHLSDMDEIATISHQYYDNHLRGGEGHMEVGKLIQHVEQKKSHMVISVKPFGCMPSSGVSDGVQSLVTAKHPEAIFCAIETTGDSAINAQSRILMDLFKARQKAGREYQDLLSASGLSQQEAERRARRRGYASALFYPTHVVAGTGSNTLMDLVPQARTRVASQRASATPAVERQPQPAPRPTALGQPRVGFKNGTIALVPVAAPADCSSGGNS